MKVINTPIVHTIDMDDTLALWKPLNDSGPEYEINWKLVHEIRKAKMRGHYVIGWSAGHVDWVKQVVVGAGLESLFDLIMTKPQFMWDDKSPLEWTRICFIK